MIIIEAHKNGREGLKVLPPIIVHDSNGNYKKEIEEMFRG